MKTHEQAVSQCPFCGHLLNRVMNTTGDRGPKPGDITLCIACERACTFTDTLGLRAASTAEVVSMLPSLVRAKTALQAAKRMQPK